MNYLLSRRKKTSKLFYVATISGLGIGLAIISLGILDYLRNKDYICFITMGLGALITIISIGLLISNALAIRSYTTSMKKNKEFMSKTAPIRVKCFGIKERRNSKFGTDWQIIAMHDYQYYYSDFIYGEPIDDEEITEYEIDLYIADEQYYLDLDSLRNEKSFR